MALMAVSPAGGTDLNLSPSSTTANCNCATSPVHGALSATKPSKLNKSARNTVHWDRIVLGPSVKENADPEARQDKLSTNTSTKGFQWSRLSQHHLLGVSDKKVRGHQQRPQLAAETFAPPELPAESTDSLPARKGWPDRLFQRILHAWLTHALPQIPLVTAT